jgi:hypothetical protein
MWALTIVGSLISGTAVYADDPLLGDPFNDSAAERAAIDEAEEGRQIDLPASTAQPRTVVADALADQLRLTINAPSTTIAFQPAVNEGLNGVIGGEVPAEVGVDALYLLPESQWDWVDQTSAALTSLYSGELDIAGQRATLDQLHAQIATLEAAIPTIEDPAQRTYMTVVAERLHRRVDLFLALLDAFAVDASAVQQSYLASSYTQASTALSQLTGQLSRMRNNEAWFAYIEAPALEAALNSQGADPAALEVITRVHEKLASRHRLPDVQASFLSRAMFVNVETALAGVISASNMPQGLSYTDTLRAMATELVAATEQYQTEMSSASSANIRRIVSQWKMVAVDGGASLADYINRNYFNYNVRIAMSEGLMERIVNERRREGDRINQKQDCITINGRQCTTTDVSVDFRPCEDSAKFTIVLNGRVGTNVTADVACIEIYADGCHCFHAEKDVCFDGFDFCLSRCRVGARANNRITGANSPVPLLGRCVESFAVNAAEDRNDETNDQIESQIRSQVCTQLNRELNRQFNDAPYRIEDEFYGPLREHGLMPETIRLSSTEDMLTVRARVMEPHEAAGSIPTLTPAVPAAGLVLQVHESTMNNAMDRMELAGRVMTETELQEEIEHRLSDLLNKEVDLPDPVTEEGEEPEVNTFVFAEEDPMRFVLEDNTVNIILRTGLLREDGSEIPTKKITVPMVFTVEPEGIVSRVRRSEAGNPEIRVEAVVPSNNPIPEAQIMRSVIQRSIQDSTRENRMELEMEEKTIEMFVRDIQVADGWLSVILE